MKLFISYAREDESTAVLLALHLEQRGIECLYDHKLRVGEKFDDQLQAMIRQSDHVLVLLTNAATSSAWVNQEIGFSVALSKPVSPLAIVRDIESEGLLEMIQQYSIFDWRDPGRTLDNLANTLLTSSASAYAYKALGLEQVLRGKVARTEFIKSALTDLRSSENRQVVIRNQAAFSIFCASEDPLYVEAGNHRPEYMQALIKEKQALLDLISTGARIELILWPVRAYDHRYLGIRYKYLLKWMKAERDNENVQYVVNPYIGPNRYIGNSDWCVEGFKLHHATGYEMSIAYYDHQHIDSALREFNAVFYQTNRDKDEAITRIEKMYEETMNKQSKPQ